MRENNLARFIKAQDSDYKTALAEIKSGHKRNCWMWYIFPQIQGLAVVVLQCTTLLRTMKKQRNI